MKRNVEGYHEERPDEIGYLFVAELIMDYSEVLKPQYWYIHCILMVV